MTLKEFAKMLDGREYGGEITKEEEALAKELGFVVVFGYSDDNAELRGAIDDETGYCPICDKEVGELDDYVDFWHENDTGNTLREFLGMSPFEYAEWLKRGDVVIQDVFSD